MSDAIQSFWKSRKKSCMAIYLGILPNLVVLVTGLQFFFVPPGSGIRPMGWAALVMLLALSPLAVIPFSIFAIIKERSVLPIVGILLSFCPSPFGHWLMQFAADRVGFILEP
jgi:hypothetical protein